MGKAVHSATLQLLFPFMNNYDDYGAQHYGLGSPVECGIEAWRLARGPPDLDCGAGHGTRHGPAGQEATAGAVAKVGVGQGAGEGPRAEAEAGDGAAVAPGKCGQG